MSHGAGFFAVSAFICVACSIAWGRLRHSGYWLLLGFLAGLMCAIRATNVFYGFFGLYPLLVQLRSPQGRGRKLLLDVALAVAGALPVAAANALLAGEFRQTAGVFLRRGDDSSGPSPA